MTLAFNANASSIAYLTSNPGMNGWKSLLNAKINWINLYYFLKITSQLTKNII